jgi:hypothetical protein
MKKLNPNPETPPKLKRFLSFGATSLNTFGGWDDFRGDFKTIKSAISHLEKYMIDECQSRGFSIADGTWNYGWAQIFDTETQKIVWTEQNN